MPKLEFKALSQKLTFAANFVVSSFFRSSWMSISTALQNNKLPKKFLQKQFCNDVLKTKNGFTLFRLVLVIFLAGAFIYAILKREEIAQQFRILSARGQTKNSPVTKTPNLSLWLETTSADSFVELELRLTTKTKGERKISYWRDLNHASKFKRDAFNGSNTTLPKYISNCINGLPCLRFDGINNYFSFDGEFLINSDYTIFIVERKNPTKAGCLLGNRRETSANEALEFCYMKDSSLRISHADRNNYYKVENSFINLTPQPKLHVFVNDSATDFANQIRHYLNGSNAPSELKKVGKPNLTNLKSYENATIGVIHSGDYYENFGGDISEMIFYNRAITDSERNAIEKYLLKKWGLK